VPINPKLKAQFEAMTTMDPEYRAKLIATLDDAPADVQNLWMSQSDYTRTSNEYKQKMDKFYADSTAAVEAYKSDAQKAQEAADAAKARIAELEAGAGVPKVPGADEAVTRELAGLKTLLTGIEGKIGTVITKEELDKQLNTAYQAAVQFIGETQFEIDEISAKHQETFGKRFDKTARTALIDFANKESVRLGHRVPLQDAYNMQMGEELKKQERAAIEKEIEEKYKTNHGIPGGSDGAAGGSPIERGPAQIRLEQEANRRAGITDASKVGYADWREAANAAASELVSEGKH
jgi:hypothetical protein